MLVTTPLIGCAKREPIYDVQHHIMPDNAKRMSYSEIEKAIIAVARQRGWECNQQDTNKIVCHIQRREHQADIAIEYTHNQFSIKNIKTSNLDQEEGEIHKKYNKWVKLLEKEITNEIRKNK